MCASSVVSDYYMNQWPQRYPRNPNPFGPLATIDPNADLRRDMAKVLQLLDKIDKRLGDVECMDEAKAKFLAQFNKGAGRKPPRAKAKGR